jgi:hypothetical protein
MSPRKAPGPWKGGLRRESNGTWTVKHAGTWLRGFRTREEALKAKGEAAQQAGKNRRRRSRESVAEFAARGPSTFRVRRPQPTSGTWSASPSSSNSTARSG